MLIRGGAHDPSDPTNEPLAMWPTTITIGLSAIRCQGFNRKGSADGVLVAFLIETARKNSCFVANSG
jgi:hypothetical protein